MQDEHVHAARTALKHARADLRLLRPSLRRTDYATANAAWRDAGRMLSPLRDARAQLAMLERVAPDLPINGELLAHVSAALHRDLIEQRAAVADRRVHRRCTRLIESGDAHVLRKGAAQANGDTLRDGLRAIYRKARNAWRQACRRRTLRELHECRKQLKYLRNAAATLHEAGLRGLGKTMSRAKRIVDWLGEEHDLAVLCATLQRHGRSRDIVDSLALLERLRAGLAARACDAGTKLFENKPKDFIPPRRSFARFDR